MYIVKESYKQSVNKRKVQKVIYKNIRGKFKHLVGLGGPDIDDYLKLARYAGIKNAIIYEYNVDQLLIQMSKKNNILPARVLYDDIYHCPAGLDDTFYDLDFTCSVSTASPHIRKFKNDTAVYTFSLRPLGLRDSVKQYVRNLYGRIDYDFVLVDETESFRQYELTTHLGVEPAYIYKDTIPMLVMSSNFSHL